MGEMRVVAFIPIKLNNQRLPGKNLLPLGGKPLCNHILDTLTKVDGIDASYVYCSDEAIKEYIPQGITFLKRDKKLDGNEVKGAEIYSSFIHDVDADYYLLLHATSPFTSAETVFAAVRAVRSGQYDSAFSAERIQTFAWYKGKPINYDLNDVPRTQDIEPVWVETSGFYLFSKELFLNQNRRIGDRPYIAEVSGLEAIDIDEKKDYELAQRMLGEFNG